VTVSQPRQEPETVLERGLRYEVFQLVTVGPQERRLDTRRVHRDILQIVLDYPQGNDVVLQGVPYGVPLDPVGQNAQHLQLLLIVRGVFVVVLVQIQDRLEIVHQNLHPVFVPVHQSRQDSGEMHQNRLVIPDARVRRTREQRPDVFGTAERLREPFELVHGLAGGFGQHRLHDLQQQMKPADSKRDSLTSRSCSVTAA
jgi:hypothetical protein